MTAVLAWFAKKAIPWKWIGVALVLTLVGGSVFAGYRFVEGLKTELAESQAKLYSAEISLKAAEGTVALLREQHAANVKRLEELEAENKAVRARWKAVTSEINSLEASNDPDAFFFDLNRLYDGVNRMLERSSRGPDSDGRALGDSPSAP
ncbi:hypothetical protein [Amorphus sp. MBR-141]